MFPVRPVWKQLSHASSEPPVAPNPPILPNPQTAIRLASRQGAEHGGGVHFGFNEGEGLVEASKPGRQNTRSEQGGALAVFTVESSADTVGVDFGALTSELANAGISDGGHSGGEGRWR